MSSSNNDSSNTAETIDQTAKNIERIKNREIEFFKEVCESVQYYIERFAELSTIDNQNLQLTISSALRAIISLHENKQFVEAKFQNPAINAHLNQALENIKVLIKYSGSNYVFLHTFDIIFL